MISKEIKRKIIAPILILIIISSVLIISFNFKTLFGLEKIEYIKFSPSGCVEKYINKKNVTPLCKEREGEMFIVNWSKKDKFNNSNYTL
jgi:hypothetical protein